LKYGYVDKADKLILPAIYQYAWDFNDGLALVSIDYKFGYIDTTGKEITPLKYSQFSLGFKDDIAIVNLGNKYGLIDKSGKEITPLKYDKIFPFSEGFAQVQESGKFGYIDKSGKEITPFKYDQAEKFIDGLGKVKKKDKQDYIDKTGKEITSFKYDDLEDFSEGLACVKKDNKYGYIDKTGAEVVALKYDYAYDFSEGLAKIRDKVNEKTKYGFIDKKGILIIPAIYDEAGSFSEGLVYVKLDNKYGFIDKTGNQIIPLKYENAEDFAEGLASVKLNHNYGFIDKTDKNIIPFKFDSAYSFSEGLAKVSIWNDDSLNSKYGFIDKFGTIVIPAEFEQARDFKDGQSTVKKKYGESYYIDYWGKEVKYYYKANKIGYVPKPIFTESDKVETLIKFVNIIHKKNVKEIMELSRPLGVSDFTTSESTEIHPVSGNEEKCTQYKSKEKILDGSLELFIYEFKSGDLKIFFVLMNPYYKKLNYKLIEDGLIQVANEGNWQYWSNGEAVIRLVSLEGPNGFNIGGDCHIYNFNASKVVQRDVNAKKDLAINVTKAKVSDTKTGPGFEIKTKTHSLKVYSGWANIFGNKTEIYPEITTNSSDAIITGRSALIFSDAPAGWVKKTNSTDRFRETIRISFEESIPETSIAKQKLEFINYAANISGLPKDKVKYLQEEVVLNDGRKGTLVFHYTNQALGIGYILNCELFVVSPTNSNQVSYYRFYMEGFESQVLSEKEFPAWKDYFKRILLTVKPITK
jgi:hypothetical protein